MTPQLAEQLVNGLALGCAYALIAIGYHLTFSVLRIANLAYGAIFMVGAMAGLVGERLTGTWLVAAPMAVMVAAAAGVLVHLVAVAPLGRVERLNSTQHIAVLGSTFGISLVIQYGLAALLGPHPRRFPPLVEPTSWQWGEVALRSDVLMNVAATVAILAALSLTLGGTAVGLRIRALTANTDLAAIVGIRVRRDQFLCVAVSAGLAGMAGLLVAAQIGVASPFIGVGYGLKGLIALIVGRTLFGTVGTALALGVAEVLVTAYGVSAYRDVVVFALLTGVLFVHSHASRDRQ